MLSLRLCQLLGFLLVWSALAAPVAVAQTSSYQLVDNQLKLLPVPAVLRSQRA